MKLKTRLAVAFMIITIVPMLLIFVSFFAINDHQARSFTKEYGLTEQVDLLNGNSTQVFNRLTRRVQQVIREELDKKPELYEDSSHLDEVNAELQKHYAYLVVRKGTDIIYFGDADEENKTQLCEQLPEFDILQGDLEGGIYLDGESQHLVKQMDFQFPDKTEGSVFIISNVDEKGALQVDSLKCEGEELSYDRKQKYMVQIIVDNNVYGWDDTEVVYRDSKYSIAVNGNPKVVNRRKYPRMPLKAACEIRLSGSDHVCEGQMLNISANGYAIQTQDKAILDTKDTLITVHTKGFTFLEDMPLRGHVIRITDNEGTYIVGCRMLEDNKAIYDYVNQNYHGE